MMKIPAFEVRWTTTTKQKGIVYAEGEAIGVLQGARWSPQDCQYKSWSMMYQKPGSDELNLIREDAGYVAFVSNLYDACLRIWIPGLKTNTSELLETFQRT